MIWVEKQGRHKREIRQANSARLGVESLEQRTLLAKSTPSFIGLVADPGDASKTALLVVGTDNNDRISFSPGETLGSVAVRFNNSSQGTFTPTGRIIAQGGEGNDKLVVSPLLDVPALLRGDAGKDKLKGGAAADVLHGGNGPDKLLGRRGRDLLIGGSNNDKLGGEEGDDILIGGDTDLADQALAAIIAEWDSSRQYLVRVNNVRDGSGSAQSLNGSNFLSSRTLNERASGDKLTGGLDRDWFFLAINSTKSSDRTTDRAADEEIDTI